MATTGFWPVKGSLKKVLNYADNPDKTTEKEYLDDDLFNLIVYAGNEDKTDQRMFVSGINCDEDHAYEDMMATKKRFGKTGGNVAYHGYQSFKPGEVTPETAHSIGVRTAQIMWGDDYEVLVTTHLNTDSVHNHFVVNSVSFKTGKKFENHIRDHYQLREISDQVCRERCLPVLSGASFYHGEKEAYWARKAGKPTHRDILKQDLEDCLKYALTWDDFLQTLRATGYSYDYTRHSIKADGWQRSVRLSRIGYSKENIFNRLQENFRKDDVLRNWRSHNSRPREFPLLDLAEQLSFSVTHTHDIGKMTIDLVFLILIRLLTAEQNKNGRQARPLSPALRAELSKLEQHQAAYRLLTEGNIHSVEELLSFIEATEGTIRSLEKQRQRCRNLLRRKKPPDEEESLRRQIAFATQSLSTLRRELKTALQIQARSKSVYELIQNEYQLEFEAQRRTRYSSRTI